MQGTLPRFPASVKGSRGHDAYSGEIWHKRINPAAEVQDRASRHGSVSQLALREPVCGWLVLNPVFLILDSLASLCSALRALVVRFLDHLPYPVQQTA